MSNTVLCAWCGEPSNGHGYIGPDRYCHDDIEYPTCYMRACWQMGDDNWGKAYDLPPLPLFGR